MSMEKLKALKHPYPATVDKIEKFGYDPKQLHHILRINDFIKKYIKGESYEKCLIPNEKEYLIQIKKGILPEAEATEMAIKIDDETKKIKNKNVIEEDKINLEAIKLLDKVKFETLKYKFIKDLKIRG